MITHDITGDRIRQAREAAGLKLGELAFLAGTAKSNLHRLEAFGDRPVTSVHKRGRTIINSIVEVLELNGATNGKA